MQKSTLRVLWPSRFEAEGFASKKINAEKVAAAAACLKFKVIILFKLCNPETCL